MLVSGKECEAMAKRKSPAFENENAEHEIGASDRALIDAFVERAWSELGLADNTLASYRLDLEAFARWLARGGSDLAACGREALFRYLEERSTKGGANGTGFKARSNARLLSTLRHFYRAMVRDGRIASDPTLLLDAPKLPRSLPKALAESEIESLLRAPAETLLGLRDRAMLELMYAAGLRVSELVGITAAQVNLRQGVLRVVGKGGKERLVPLGDEAAHWLTRYVEEARPAAQPRPTTCGCVPLSLFCRSMLTVRCRRLRMGPRRALQSGDSARRCSGRTASCAS